MARPRSVKNTLQEVLGPEDPMLTTRPIREYNFKPGKSGNPGGARKRAEDPIAYAKQYGRWCIDEWRKIVRDPNTSKELKNKAILNIMQYGFGKPSQSIKHTLNQPADTAPDQKQIALDKEMSDAMSTATDIIKQPSISEVDWSKDVIDLDDDFSPDKKPKDDGHHIDPFAVPDTSNT